MRAAHPDLSGLVHLFSISQPGHSARQYSQYIMLHKVLAYPVTRPVELGITFNILFVTFMIGFTVMITLLSVASGGYELVPVTSPYYNVSYHLFYEKFIPASS